ncbi:PCL5 [Candida oxycetoniae]|uniref:PCL5 n=1 Tax=Candida oxycetoniae TaxID=497107 RepID=A0AAI9SWP5_9ASCO|nr:PCL5 [Candida oxycetoniae]KAI3404135.2 PCL5 [Candida oxycetoniae]
MHSPYSPTKEEEQVSRRNKKRAHEVLLTPPDFATTTTTTTNSRQFSNTPEFLSSPSSPLSLASPNQHKYYNANLSKAQFNSILVTCAANLLKILYTKDTTTTTTKVKQVETKAFIIEVLRRSRTSIQSLQLTCFYIYKLICSSCVIKLSAHKLFLGLIIIASKFNQDYNYSLKSWCKICGVDGEERKNVQQLREIEISLLKSLNYELVLQSEKYDNWCNILLIFGYDFIKRQLIWDSTNSEIVWDLEVSSNTSKITKWFKFFKDLNIDNLNLLKISFESYFKSQMNQKVFVVEHRLSLGNRKRCMQNDATLIFEQPEAKKVKV